MTDAEAKIKQSSKETFAVVGELVMVSTALDFALNRVLITVLDLGNAAMIESVVATLDPSRKVELLKARAASMPSNDWKKALTKFCERVETVFYQRNIACHTAPVLRGGFWQFTPVAAAKVLKKIDILDKTIQSTTVQDFAKAIKTGEAAFGSFEDIITNFTSFHVEKKRRDAAKA